MSTITTETTVPIARVKPWPGNPRKTFDEGSLAELAESLKSLGILQPLLVRPLYFYVVQPPAVADGPWYAAARRVSNKGVNLLDHYLTREKAQKAVDTLNANEDPPALEIADGERRYRAALLAGIADVPVRIRELTDREMLEIAITSGKGGVQR